MIIVKTFFGMVSSPKIDGEDLALVVAKVTDDILEHTFDIFYFMKLNVLGKYADCWLLRSKREKSIIERINKIREIAKETIEERISLR